MQEQKFKRLYEAIKQENNFIIEEYDRQQMIDKINKVEQRANQMNNAATTLQGAFKGYKARKTVKQKQTKQFLSQMEHQSDITMRPKEVRPKPTPYIPPHVETQTPAQRDSSIRALLNQV